MCNSNEALREGRFYDLQYANPYSEHYDSNRIYSYLRGSEKELLLIVTNFGDSNRSCKVTIPREAYAYFSREATDSTVNTNELLTGKELSITLSADEPIELEIPANGGVIIPLKL